MRFIYPQVAGYECVQECRHSTEDILPIATVCTSCSIIPNDGGSPPSITEIVQVAYELQICMKGTPNYVDLDIEMLSSVYSPPKGGK